jgi:hypothetical protein
MPKRRKPNEQNRKVREYGTGPRQNRNPAGNGRDEDGNLGRAGSLGRDQPIPVLFETL